jgi:hypothetical protein
MKKRPPSQVTRLRRRAVGETGTSQQRNKYGLNEREMDYCLHVLAGLKGHDAALAAGYGGDCYKRHYLLKLREPVQNFLAKYKPDNLLGDEKALIPQDKEGAIKFIREVASGVRRIGSIQLQALRDYAGILGVNFEAAVNDKGAAKLHEVLAVMRAGPVPTADDETCSECGSLITPEKKKFDKDRRAKEKADRAASTAVQ